MKHLIETAKLQARKSICYRKHGAVLATRKGHIVSVGHNSWLNHAEEAVLRKIPKWIDRKDLVLVVVRINRNDELRKSNPCKSCEAKIIKAGIPVVYFS